MDENRIKGAVRNVEGKIEDAVGGLTGDTRTQMEGKLDQGAGKVQGAFGKAKDDASHIVKQATDVGTAAASAVQDAAQKAGAQAADAGERLYEEGRRAIQEQPVTAVLVAAAIGYAVCYLFSRR